MIDNPIQWILDNQKELDSRDDKLRQKENILGLLVQEQNDKFEKLRKGYKVLGYVTDDECLNQTPITRDRFLIESEKLEIRFKTINRLPRSTKEMFKTQDDLEKYLVDMVTLLTDRWNTAYAYRELWRKERNGFRQEEIKLQDDYIEIANEKTNQTDTEWVKSADKLFVKNKKLIEEQKNKLYLEEELQKEFETLFEYREKLLKLAETLFTI